MKTRIAAVVLIILAIFSAVVFYMLKSEESRITEKFDKLAVWCSKKESEQGLLGLIKLSHDADNIFSSSTILKLHYSGMKNRKTPDEIAKMAMRARKIFDSLEISFHDLEIDIYSTTHARAVVTVDLKAKTGGRVRVSDITELECELEKIDGVWLFSSIKTVEVLKR
ncbi:MAG: hypothetical protein ACYTFY_23145 [Planctomycetota bacterium]